MENVGQAIVIGSVALIAFGVGWLIVFGVLWQRNHWQDKGHARDIEWEREERATKETESRIMASTAPGGVELADRGTSQLTVLLPQGAEPGLYQTALLHIVGEVKRNNPRLSLHGLQAFCFGSTGGPDYKKRQAFIIALLQEVKTRDEKRMAAQ